VRAGGIKEAEPEKGDDAYGRQGEERHRSPAVLSSGETRPHRPRDNEEPDDQAHEKQYLPKPSQLQELPALVRKPKPRLSSLTLDSRGRTHKRPDDYDHHSGKEKIHEQALALGLFLPR